MKTTLDIPPELLRRTKATAALQGQSLREFVTLAIEARLAAQGHSRPDRSGWRSVFGLAAWKELQSLEQVVGEELERVEPSEWK